jgi:dienelactone hydrolase
LRKTLIDEGYAWAASSYSENGYTPGIGADDTLALKQLFTQKVGTPERTYITGASMGGNVVTLSLEHYPKEYDGALAMCGALGGEEIIDYLVSWNRVAEYVSGAKLAFGPGTTLAQATGALGQVTTALGSPDSPTAKGRQFLSVMRMLTGGPRPFFLEGLKQQYLVNFGFVLIDPEDASLAARAATNEGVQYSIEPGLGLTLDQLNAGVVRQQADPQARNASLHADAVPTSGNIQAPLLTLHDTGDLFVPITQEQSYRAKVNAAGKGDLLVQRAIRDAGHCKFSDQEMTTAWNDLRSWVANGEKPRGDDLSGDLADIGRQFTNPIRPGDPGTR